MYLGPPKAKSSCARQEEEEEEEEFFNHYKNDLERHAHAPRGCSLHSLLVSAVRGMQRRDLQHPRWRAGNLQTMKSNQRDKRDQRAAMIHPPTPPSSAPFTTSFLRANPTIPPSRLHGTTQSGTTFLIPIGSTNHPPTISKDAAFLHSSWSGPLEITAPVQARRAPPICVFYSGQSLSARARPREYSYTDGRKTDRHGSSNTVYHLCLEHTRKHAHARTHTHTHTHARTSIS